MSPDRLHADARAVLLAWSPPDSDQDAIRRDFLTHLNHHDDGMWRECRPDHITGSAIVVRPASPDFAEVLLVMHSKARKWLQMGGHCEPDDRTLGAVALREAGEESGIEGLTLDPVPLRLSRHRVPFCGGGHHLDVQFLVTAPPGIDASPGPEADEVGWFTEAPEPTDQDVRDLIAAAKLRLRGSP